MLPDSSQGFVKPSNWQWGSFRYQQRNKTSECSCWSSPRSLLTGPSLATASLLEPSAAQKVVRFLVSKGKEWEEVSAQLSSVRCRGNFWNLPSVCWGVESRAHVVETLNIFKTLDFSKLAMRADVPVPSPLQTLLAVVFHPGSAGIFADVLPPFQLLTIRKLRQAKEPLLGSCWSLKCLFGRALCLGRSGALELQPLSCFSDTVLGASHPSERPRTISS